MNKPARKAANGPDQGPSESQLDMLAGMSAWLTDVETRHDYEYPTKLAQGEGVSRDESAISALNVADYIADFDARLRAVETEFLRREALYEKSVTGKASTLGAVGQPSRRRKSIFGQNGALLSAALILAALIGTVVFLINSDRLGMPVSVPAPAPPTIVPQNNVAPDSDANDVGTKVPCTGPLSVAEQLACGIL